MDNISQLSLENKANSKGNTKVALDKASAAMKDASTISKTQGFQSCLIRVDLRLSQRGRCQMTSKMRGDLSRMLIHLEYPQSQKLINKIMYRASL